MLPPRPFFFLRHGQTDWNAQGRIQGHTDVPLNATGVAQAQAAAGRLAGRGIDWIVSSPLARARATADFVAARLGLPVHLDDDLKERRFGAFEGMIADEVKRAHGLAPDQPHPAARCRAMAADRRALTRGRCQMADRASRQDRAVRQSRRSVPRPA
jgi:2,3-bisphosphoglycerate-dependent phosphoglycerate mutase